MLHPHKREESHLLITVVKAGVTHSVTSEQIKMNANIVLGTECFPGEGFCFNFHLCKYVVRKYESACVLCNSVSQSPLGR